MRRPLALALALATAGLVGTAFQASQDPRRALFAWIAAYAFVFSTVVSTLVLLMILDVAGATWSIVLRPMLGAISGTMPILIVLFLPIVIGMPLVYPWARPTTGLAEDIQAALAHQRAWNNPAFFVVRSAIYLGAWCFLAEAARGSKRFSAAGIPIIALTITFAAFDWLMSLEPGWTSTIFGVYVFATGLVSAISLVIVLALLERRVAYLPDAVGPSHFHALGRLLHMAVIFWAYIAFFQLLLIWIANLPREVVFFLARVRGTSAFISALQVVGHFAFPFLVLLSRSLKRSPPAVAAMGVWLLGMGVLDAAWLVIPASGKSLAPIDLAAFLAVCGVVLAFGVWRFGRPLANEDPALAESLRYESL